MAISKRENLHGLSKRLSLFDVILTLALILIAFSSIVPIWYTLMISLSDKSAVAGGKVFLWPIGLNVMPYINIMKDRGFGGSFLVSVIRVLLGTSITMVVIIMMAYPLSKNKNSFRGRNACMWIVLFCMLFHGGLIPWYETIIKLGLYDSIWALVLGNGLPVFNVILLMNFYRNLPHEMEEAALVDGAGPWFILLKLIIPVSVPAIATVTLFTILGHWNDFFSGLILMSKPDHYPLQTYIQQFVVQINTQNMTQDQLKGLNKLSDQTLNAAKIFIAMIPVLIVYPYFQRYFVTGITLGAVKE